MNVPRRHRQSFRVLLSMGHRPHFNWKSLTSKRYFSPRVDFMRMTSWMITKRGGSFPPSVDGAYLHDEYPIRPLDSRQPVRNENHASAFRRLVECLLHQSLAFHVQRRSGLVEQQDLDKNKTQSMEHVSQNDAHQTLQSVYQTTEDMDEAQTATVLRDRGRCCCVHLGYPSSSRRRVMIITLCHQGRSRNLFPERFAATDRMSATNDVGVGAIL